jgi:hypothetical protein
MSSSGTPARVFQEHSFTVEQLEGNEYIHTIETVLFE